MFINYESMRGSWQSFERLICRYLAYRHYDRVRIVGASGDKGADIIAHKDDIRWLFQVKSSLYKAGAAEVEKTIQALPIYRAKIPAIVCRGGFNSSAHNARERLRAEGTVLNFFDSKYLLDRAKEINPSDYPPQHEKYHETRPYQEEAINQLMNRYRNRRRGDANKGMVVMATGLGKTRVMCEFVRRICTGGSQEESQYKAPKILVLAHANDIVYQLERAFWPYLRADQETAVWNGSEPRNANMIDKAAVVFACLNTVAQHAESGREFPDFDVVIVDECHHVGASGMYDNVLEEVGAGNDGGPFLIGVTATPWRKDEYNIINRFGHPVITIDLVAGLKRGFLTNIDYRMYTTNIDWTKFSKFKTRKGKVSPRGINRTIFISEWDDGVITQLEKTWAEQNNPRAIIFCGTIKHALMMRAKINARHFCKAEAVFSGVGNKEKQATHERNRIISDFQVGIVDAICCVDIFNEGIDVPDVNIVVFQRVTHSRRIFVQQLGRGLRLAEGKDKVIVLDFVSDIRRFAVGLELKNAIKNIPVRLNHKIDFVREGGEHDEKAESFLREWLEDIADAENMDADTAELKFPPILKPE